MPVLRETKPKAKSALALAVEEELELMAESAGIGPRALGVKAKRLKVLLGLERDLTEDERDELDALILERATDRRHRKDYDALIEAARTRWATRSVADPEWVAKWEKRAAESRRRYGSKVTAQDVHFVHVITTSKEARRIERQAERGYGEVERIKARRARRADKAARAERQSEPTPSTAAAASPSIALSTTPPLETQPRRSRATAGVVAEYDLQGRRMR